MARLTGPPLRAAMMPSKVATIPARTDAFYQSREWRALIAKRKRDQDYAAAAARARPGERLILDHIIERKDGGADLDPANTQWLTFSEHQAKTAQAKAARIVWR